MRIRVGFTDCDGWDCWECQATGTPILGIHRPSWLFLPNEGRVSVSGLGVTFRRAYSSQLHSYAVSVRWSSTGSDYCLVAWGGQAAIVGLGGNRSVPSLIPTLTECRLPTSTLAFKSRLGFITRIDSQVTARIHGLKAVVLRLFSSITEFVRKADVDEVRKETRLQGLKDQLALSDDPDAEDLPLTARESRPSREVVRKSEIFVMTRDSVSRTRRVFRPQSEPRTEQGGRESRLLY